jgi:hypothetical protein
VLATLAYKPFAIVLGIAASKAAGKAFDSAWERSHGAKPPKATTEEATWGQVVSAAALHATTFAVTAAVVNRAGAKTFRYITGFWPGEQRPEPVAQVRARNG